MPKIVVGATLLAAGLQVLVAAPAGAHIPPPRRCSFASVADATGDMQAGEIDGGPLLPPVPGESVVLTCTIQVGAAEHSGPDAASVASEPAPVAVIPPTPVSYAAPAGEIVYLCTQATVDGVDYYWDAGELNGIGDWSTSAAATCDGPRTLEFPGPTERLLLHVVTHALEGEVLDPLVCSVLVSLAPVVPGVPGVIEIDPTGDLHVAGVFVWNCPPYET